MNLSAVILAGGRSSRMGRDKAGLVFQGQTLLARQVQLARDVGAAEVFVSGRSDKNYAEWNGRVLVDNFPGAGPLAGIEAALRVCSSPLLLVLAVDMPQLNAELLRKLFSQGASGCGVVPRVAGRIEPLGAIYPRSAAGLAKEMLSKASGFTPGVRVFAEACVADGRATFLDFPAVQANHFASWNVPQDLPADETRGE